MNTSTSTAIDTYLKSKKDIWTEATVKAAASRLMQYSPHQVPAANYSRMKQEGYKPYYIKITFITIASFIDWTIAQGCALSSSNNYNKFLKENNQLFRNVYEDKYATISWQEYLQELDEADDALHQVLLLLGFGGCRLSELYTFDGVSVLGKGGKRRNIYLPAGVVLGPISLSPTQIRRRLKHNPHSYRKLAADQWLRGGVDLKTVQTLLGHTSLASTQRYLRPLEQDALNNKLQNIWGTSLQ